jgi:hypothetical protein
LSVYVCGDMCCCCLPLPRRPVPRREVRLFSSSLKARRRRRRPQEGPLARCGIPFHRVIPADVVKVHGHPPFRGRGSIFIEHDGLSCERRWRSLHFRVRDGVMLDVAAAMFARVSTMQRKFSARTLLLRPSDSALGRHASAQRMKSKADHVVLFTDGFMSSAQGGPFCSFARRRFSFLSLSVDELASIGI